MSIQKYIHYVWLGEKPISERFASYIENWKKILIDYKFIEWNEKTFDVEKNEWVKKAIRAKNYALAADVIRCWALLNYGGIYLDTDVELLKTFDYLVEQYDFFMGYETNYWLGCAIIGARKGHPVMIEAYKRYQNPCPVLNNKSNMLCVLNFTASIGRIYNVNFNGKKVVLPDKGILFTRDYFFPKNYITRKTKLTENSLTIHHYGSTWHSLGKLIGIKIASFMVHLLGYRLFGLFFETIARSNMLRRLDKEYRKNTKGANK